MGLDNVDQLKRAGDELEVLEGVIGYAERMISEEGSGSPYRALRRQAYGKTVTPCSGYLWRYKSRRMTKDFCQAM